METVSCRRFIREAQVHSQASLCGIYGAQSSTNRLFSIASVSLCQDHSIIASYAFALHDT